MESQPQQALLLLSLGAATVAGLWALARCFTRDSQDQGIAASLAVWAIVPLAFVALVAWTVFGAVNA